MKRLEKNQIIKIIELRKSGRSLGKICNHMKLKKSIVYYYINKNFGRSYKLVKINYVDENAIGEIIGVFAGDGNFCKDKRSCYQIRFYFSENEILYARKFSKLLEKTFGKKPYIYRYGSPKNKIEIRYKSKTIYKFITKYLFWKGKRTYSIKLHRTNHTLDFIIGFLRGYFDSEGYTYPDREKIEIVTTSKNMMHQLIELIDKLGLKSILYKYIDKRGNRKPCFYIILKDIDAINFIRLIRPRNDKRINSGFVV